MPTWATWMWRGAASKSRRTESRVPTSNTFTFADKSARLDENMDCTTRHEAYDMPDQKERVAEKTGSDGTKARSHQLTLTAPCSTTMTSLRVAHGSSNYGQQGRGTGAHTRVKGHTRWSEGNRRKCCCAVGQSPWRGWCSTSLQCSAKWGGQQCSAMHLGSTMGRREEEGSKVGVRGEDNDLGGGG